MTELDYFPFWREGDAPEKDPTRSVKCSFESLWLWEPLRVREAAVAARQLETGGDSIELSERQASVLRAIVQAYVGEAAPIGSQTLTHLLPIQISSASVRATLAELAGMGLVEKPHSSSGRIPTERGLRVFVDRLLDRKRLDASSLASYDVRNISYSFDEAEADSVVKVASQLLSECTRQLGFVVAPRLERIVLSRISLVRLSSERVLVLLVSKSGGAHRRVIACDRDWSSASSIAPHSCSRSARRVTRCSRCARRSSKRRSACAIARTSC